MANVDRPNGFKFAKGMNGVACPVIRRYEAGDRSSDTTNNHGDIYLGDPVKLSSGKVLPANSGDTILGVVVGVGKETTSFSEAGAFNPDDLTQKYAPLTDATGWYVWVIPAEGNLFEAQTAADLDLVPGSSADFGTDANEAHGSQSTGLSSAELITSTNADCEVVEQVTTPDNDVTLVNARHIVQFVTTQHAQ